MPLMSSQRTPLTAVASAVFRSRQLEYGTSATAGAAAGAGSCTNGRTHTWCSVAYVMLVELSSMDQSRVVTLGSRIRQLRPSAPVNRPYVSAISLSTCDSMAMSPPGRLASWPTSGMALSIRVLLRAAKSAVGAV